MGSQSQEGQALACVLWGLHIPTTRYIEALQRPPSDLSGRLLAPQHQASLQPWEPLASGCVMNEGTGSWGMWALPQPCCMFPATQRCSHPSPNCGDPQHPLAQTSLGKEQIHKHEAPQGLGRGTGRCTSPQYYCFIVI